MRKQFLVSVLLSSVAFSVVWAKPTTEEKTGAQQQLWQQLYTEGVIDEQRYRKELALLPLQTQTQKNRGPVGTASISGNVNDGVAPIVNSFVYLYNSDTYDYVDGQPTDGSGNYSFSSLADGNYFLRISDAADIYIDGMWGSSGFTQCSQCDPQPDNIIALGVGEVRGGVDFTLVEGATIAGSVTDDATSAPVETLNMQLYDPIAQQYWYVQSLYDGLGGYEVRGVPAGDWIPFLQPNDDNLHIPEIYNNVQCNTCGVQLFAGAGTTVTTVLGGTVPGIDFALERGASISGFVRDNITFNPLQEYGAVYVFDATNRLMQAVIVYGTNIDPMADGSYTVGGLLPGIYFVQGGDLGREFYQRELYANLPCPWSGCDRGAGGTPVPLAAAEDRLGVNFLLDYGGKIAGSVVDGVSGNPIANGEEIYLQFYDGSGNVAGGAYAQPDGSYTAARSLAPGTYSVRTGTMFSADLIPPYVNEKYDSMGNIDCPGVTCDLTAGNVVVSAYNPALPDPATAATTSNIDFALDTGLSFSGTITELGSASPIADVWVLVYDSNGDFANYAITAADGSFTVHGLTAGTYYARTNNGSNLPFMGFYPAAAGGWIDILWDGIACPGGGCDVTTGTPIVLPTRGAELDFELEPGGTIAGQVMIADTQVPAANIGVNVYDENGLLFGTYQTDDQGNYETVGFPAGNYYLTTTNDGALVNVIYGAGYCYTESCDPLNASPIALSQGVALTDVDMDLPTDFLFRSGLEGSSSP